MFVKNEFFDAKDLVQVKYEMLRTVREDNDTVRAAAERFGVSRMTWYDAERAFDGGGLAALARRKPGPKARHKLTAEVVEALIEARTDNSRIRIPELVMMVHKRFGVHVHRRTIERFLNESDFEKNCATKSMNNYFRIDSVNMRFHVQGCEWLRSSVVDPAIPAFRNGLAVLISRGVLAWMCSFEAIESQPCPVSKFRLITG